MSDVGPIGGAVSMTGEVSRAHHGALFQDELPGFKRHVIEMLRQVLKDGVPEESFLHVLGLAVLTALAGQRKSATG